MMDPNKILQTDVLDIIFHGRNKEYGAYELRTNYKKRLFISVTSMIFGIALLLLVYSFASGRSSQQVKEVVIADNQLEEIKKNEEPPPVEPPKPKPQQQIEVKQYTPPVITNEEVKPDEAPPEMEELQDTKIGTIDQEGEKDDGIVAPPVDDVDKGVIETPKKKDPEPEIYMSVQIESAYPGGVSAWLRFLTKTLPQYYTGDIVENGIQGRVVVQFIVDTEGNVSEVHGIEGPKELWEIAEKVIRKSGKWTPAIQNGREVKSYKRQPIIFRLESE